MVVQLSRGQCCALAFTKDVQVVVVGDWNARAERFEFEVRWIDFSGGGASGNGARVNESRIEDRGGMGGRKFGKEADCGFGNEGDGYLGRGGL